MCLEYAFQTACQIQEKYKNSYHNEKSVKEGTIVIFVPGEPEFGLESSVLGILPISIPMLQFWHRNYR